MIGIFHCLFYIHSFSWKFAKWWHCCPFPMSSRAGLYACMKVDVFLLIEALSREISCRNEACAVEAWDFFTLPLLKSKRQWCHAAPVPFVFYDCTISSEPRHDEKPERPCPVQTKVHWNSSESSWRWDLSGYSVRTALTHISWSPQPWEAGA